MPCAYFTTELWAPCLPAKQVVRPRGIEPRTSCVSCKRSTTELWVLLFYLTFIFPSCEDRLTISHENGSIWADISHLTIRRLDDEILLRSRRFSGSLGRSFRRRVRQVSAALPQYSTAVSFFRILLGEPERQHRRLLP